MSKWFAVFAALLLASACARRPADELTIDFTRGEEVIVTAQSELDSTATREAALAGFDPWAVRFGRLNAEFHRTSFERSRGTLERVIHTVKIPRSSLQQIFSDTSITVEAGPGSIIFYPGTSVRATREQRQHFEAGLNRWSSAIAVYYDAIHRLYRYMDANPDRAEALFETIVAPPGFITPPLFEDEQPYVDQTLRAMNELGALIDAEERDGALYAEEADLMFNPFPARISVVAPGSRTLVIEPVDLYEAAKKLEGRWISPDPFVELLRNKDVSSFVLARRERKSSLAIRPGDISAALREHFTRQETYSLNW